MLDGRTVAGEARGYGTHEYPNYAALMNAFLVDITPSSLKIDEAEKFQGLYRYIAMRET